MADVRRLGRRRVHPAVLALALFAVGAQQALATPSTQGAVAALRAKDAAHDPQTASAVIERPPAAPSTWYTRGAVAALRAADATHDSRAAGAAAVNSGLADALGQLPNLGPDWLRRSAIELRLDGELRPTYGVRTVQPLYRTRSERDTVLVEGRLARDSGGERTTGAAGLGYQRLVHRDRLLVGGAVFSDHEWAWADRHRLRAGVAVRSRPLRFDAIHQRTVQPDAAPGLGGALNGYRLELDLQLPHLPWARVYGERLREETNARGDVSGRDRFGLRLNPLPPLEVELGGTATTGADPAYAARVRYTKVLGRPPAKRGPLIDHRPFAFDDVRAQRDRPMWR